jgi:hypothetical protein
MTRQLGGVERAREHLGDFGFNEDFFFEGLIWW